MMINEKLFKTVPKNVQSLKYSSCYYLEKADSRKKKMQCVARARMSRHIQILKIGDRNGKVFQYLFSPVICNRFSPVKMVDINSVFNP